MGKGEKARTELSFKESKTESPGVGFMRCWKCRDWTTREVPSTVFFLREPVPYPRARRVLLI